MTNLEGILRAIQQAKEGQPIPAHVYLEHMEWATGLRKAEELTKPVEIEA